MDSLARHKRLSCVNRCDPPAEMPQTKPRRNQFAYAWVEETRPSANTAVGSPVDTEFDETMDEAMTDTVSDMEDPDMHEPQAGEKRIREPDIPLVSDVESEDEIEPHDPKFKRSKVSTSQSQLHENEGTSEVPPVNDSEAISEYSSITWTNNEEPPIRHFAVPPRSLPPTATHDEHDFHSEDAEKVFSRQVKPGSSRYLKAGSSLSAFQGVQAQYGYHYRPRTEHTGMLVARRPLNLEPPRSVSFSMHRGTSMDDLAYDGDSDVEDSPELGTSTRRRSPSSGHFSNLSSPANSPTTATFPVDQADTRERTEREPDPRKTSMSSGFDRLTMNQTDKISERTVGAAQACLGESTPPAHPPGLASTSALASISDVPASAAKPAPHTARTAAPIRVAASDPAPIPAAVPTPTDVSKMAILCRVAEWSQTHDIDELMHQRNPDRQQQIAAAVAEIEERVQTASSSAASSPTVGHFEGYVGRN